MDAKSKASFINSVAAGRVVPCPKCNTANKPESKFCISCGAALSAPIAKKNVPAFSNAPDDSQQNNKKVTKYVEPTSVFADGLPSWDIVPPQVMVRRR